MPLPVSAYANNLALVPPAAPKGGAARKAAAMPEAHAQLVVKRAVDRANAILDRLEARSAEIAKEQKRLAKRKAIAQAKYERCEDRVITLMQDAGLASCAGIFNSFRLQNAPVALEIVDQSLIPAAFFRTPKAPSAEVDKVALKLALAQNDELDPASFGVRLTSKTSLIRT